LLNLLTHPPTTKRKTTNMKRIASIILLASLTASAQVSTHCTTNGNNTDCDSYDYGAQNRANYEADQQLGNATGGLIAGPIAAVIRGFWLSPRTHFK